jgi:uncharacterized YccA/Bax inhibitor family protein
LATSNPAFSKQAFAGYEQVYGASRSTVMTVQGTVGKTAALLAILSATAIYSWSAAGRGEFQAAALWGSLIGGLVFCLITIFRPSLAPWTAPLYAGMEGVLLGASSYMIEHYVGKGYPGIALQAVSMTVGTLCVMLFIYGTGLIRVTNRLRVGITAAMGAVCLIYMMSFVASLFGARIPFIDQPTGIGIGFSVVVVGIAAFKLLLDFDFIEKAAQAGAPKYMEWYGAFGLILTLVWLYLEIIDLLRKLQDQDRR